jgi:hypothetical protein
MHRGAQTWGVSLGGMIIPAAGMDTGPNANATIPVERRLGQTVTRSRKRKPSGSQRPIADRPTERSVDMASIAHVRSTRTTTSGRSHPSWGFPRKSNGDHHRGNGKEQTG